MKNIIILLCTTLLLASCGTTRGVFDGTGTVLEGIATDFRSAGNELCPKVGDGEIRRRFEVA